MDTEAFRRSQRDRPFHPYEVLAGTDRPGAGRTDVADVIMDTGWRWREHPPVILDPPVDWESACASNRSWAFHLQSWDALSPVLAAHDVDGDRRYLRFAVDVALDWIRRYPDASVPSEFAWYDMSVGLRAYRLAYILDAASRDDAHTDDEVARLLDAVLGHAGYLDDDENFAAHSNHGFYQSAGHLALLRRLGWLPELDGQDVAAHDRLHRLIQQQFAVDGVHREHSPDYHRMVLETLIGLIDADLIDDPTVARYRRTAEDALAWFSLPNGRLATFGDSSYRLMDTRRSLARADLESPHLRYVLTHGKQGSPPDDHVAAFVESGYAVLRSHWPPLGTTFTDASYLAQICAFHSRTHKHADDLSFIWYDHATEILIDAGRFGYLGRTEPGSELHDLGFWYDHPSRVYVESTRAHNTVEIDDHSQRRRGRKPYGSALEEAGAQDGVLYSSAHVRHGTVRHARMLLHVPRRWLIVFDWLWDNEREPHRFSQRFHFAPEVDVTASENRLAARLPGHAPPLHVLPLLPAELAPPVRGQEEPKLLGWVSRRDEELEPCWTAAYLAEDTADHRFATLFSFGDRPEVDAEFSRANASGRAAHFRWRDPVEHTVSFSRPEDGPVTVAYGRD